MDIFEVKVNDTLHYKLEDHHLKALCHDLNEDMLLDELKRRIEWVIMHKYDQCFKRIKQQWDKKLADNGVTMIPTDAKAYLELVRSQPNYKDRKARDAEAHKEESSEHTSSDVEVKISG